MKDPASRFPSLGSSAALADVQVRLTLAMGLAPLGISLLLMAAMAPDWPRPGLWVGAGLALAGMGLIGGLWRRSGHRYMRGYSTTHFLVRYLFLVLGPVLLWMVFAEVILEMAGWAPPLLLALLLVLYPLGRILKERVDPDPHVTPRIEKFRLVLQQSQWILGVLAFTGMLSGAVVDAQKDYPTDPTPLILFFWLLAAVAVLGGLAAAAERWRWISGRPGPRPALDDPPPAKPPAHPVRFGSEKF